MKQFDVERFIFFSSSKSSNLWRRRLVSNLRPKYYKSKNKTQGRPCTTGENYEKISRAA